jgi:tetratricopeptide (TPR) repeat protein
MKFTRIFELFCICLFLMVSGCYTAKRSVVNLKPNDSNSKLAFYSKSDLPDIYGKAKNSFDKKKYDEVIALLSAPAYDEPSNWEINLLLGKAEVEQCEILKDKGDNAYKALARKAYERGRNLYQMNQNNPEPYYIIAKSRVFLNRTMKALEILQRGLRMSPKNPEMLVLLGDIYATDQGKKQKAIEAYSEAIEIKKGDSAFEKAVRNKMKKIPDTNIIN